MLNVLLVGTGIQVIKPIVGMLDVLLVGYWYSDDKNVLLVC